MNWKVVIKGNDNYLEFLSKELIDHKLSIIKDGNEFILKLDEINTLSNYNEVEGKVIELLDSLNSIELLFITFPIKLEYHIYLIREDGTLSPYIDITKKNTVNKRYLRFSFESLKKSEVYNLIKDCNNLTNDNNVKDVFQLINHNFYSWITWYKIIEILQKDDYKPIKKVDVIIMKWID